MTAQAEEPESITEEWLYKGRRLDTAGKSLHLWLDAQQGEHAFSKMKGLSIGARYRVTLSADGKQVYTGGTLAPRYLGESGDREQTRMWELMDREAQTQLEMTRAAKNTDSQLDQALAPIRERYRKTIGAGKRAALLALVIQRITG